MDLAYLRTFLLVLERESLSAAAEELGLSQPAVSKRIRRLEQELGCPLLVRDPRGVRPTQAGRLVAEGARSILAEERELARRLRELWAEELQGELEIGASTIPGEYLAPSLLSDMRRKWPGVVARLRVGDTAEVVGWIATGQSDLGLAGARLGGRRGLAWEPFVTDEIVLAVPRSHWLARQGVVQPEELAGLPLLQREPGSGTRQMVDMLLAEQGISLPRETAGLVLGSTQALLQAVARGLGVGFISLRALRSWEGPDAPVPVRVAGVRLKRQLWTVYRTERAEQRLIREVLAFIRTWAAGHRDP